MKRDIESRVREGVKTVLEEVLEEKISEHLKAHYRELTPTRRGEHNAIIAATWLRLRLGPYRERLDCKG